MLTLLLFPGISKATVPSGRENNPKKNGLFLWEQGKNAFGKAENNDAVWAFKTFIEKHPGSKGYLDAHLFLGISYLRLEKHDLAIKPLKYYVTAMKDTVEGMRAKLLLSRAYLGSKKSQEAFFSSIEVIERNEKKSLPAEVYLQSILIKSWSLIGLNKDFRAKRALGTFRNALRSKEKLNPEKPLYPSLVTEFHRLNIELTLRSCSNLPKKPAKDEGSILEQIRKRGQCLLQALVQFQNALHSGHPVWVESAQKALVQGFGSHDLVCRAPPGPAKKLTKIQRKRFKEELAFVLRYDCRQTRERALELLTEWKKELPKSMEFYSNRLLDNINALNGSISDGST